MFRNWLLGLFVLGLTAYCCARVLFFDRDEAKAGQRPSGGEGPLAPGESAAGEPPILALSADPRSTPSNLEPVTFVAATEQESKMVQRMRDPLRGNPASSPLVLDFDDLDMPGGARRESPENARKVAIEAVHAARSAQELGTDPVSVAAHLTRAILSGGLSEEEEAGAYESLLKVNRHGLLDRGRDFGCFREEVQSGDSLWSISNRLMQQGHPPLEAGLVQLFNGMPNTRIYAGTSLRIPREALGIQVQCSRFKLNVLVGEVLLRRYSIALGKEGSPTPLGEFRIATREKEPTWFRPGGSPIKFGEPGNVLGTRWLGFASKPDFPNADTFGVHGTNDPESIGTLASNGCVRMLNEDVQELFDWVPVGARVQIDP